MTLTIGAFLADRSDSRAYKAVGTAPQSICVAGEWRRRSSGTVGVLPSDRQLRMRTELAVDRLRDFVRKPALRRPPAPGAAP